MALIWVGIGALARQRFHAEPIELRSPRTERKALTERVVFIVLDGVRADRFAATFPKTHAIAKSRGVVVPSITGPLTFTVTGVYTLATGAYPTMALLPQNFQALPTGEDSLPASLARTGKRTVVIGESVWRDLFAQDITAAATIRDLGPYADQKLPASQLLGRALEEDRCELCVWHDPLIDKKAHLYGIFDKRYVDYAAGLDAQVSALVEQSDAATTWIVTSDHGALDSGNHGGDQAEARSSFFAGWGPGISPGDYTGAMAQADIPTLTAALLGAPIPAISEGVVPPFIAIPDVGRPPLDAELLSQKRALLAELSRARGEPTVSVASVAESLPRIAALKQPSSLGLWLAVIPLWAAAVLLIVVASPSTGAIPTALAGVGIAFLLLQTALAHFALPRVSLSAAAAAYAGTCALLIAAAAVALRSVARRGPALLIFVAACTLALTEAHWVILVAPFGLVVSAWFWSPPRLKVVGVAATAALAALVTGLGWTYVLDSSKDLTGPWVLLLTAPIAALYGYFRNPAPSERNVLAVATPLIICLAAERGPTWFAPYLPVVVVLVLYAGRAWRLLPGVTLGAVEGGVLALSNLQMGALQWSFLLLLVLAVPYALESARLRESLGEPLTAWLQGALLVAVAYLFVVAEGNRISPSDIKVLSGFLGGALPLWLPLTGAMLSLYYSALPLLLVASWRRRAHDAKVVRAAVRCAAAILGAKLLYLGVNFAWAGMSQGSWAKQLVECILALGWLTTLLLTSELSSTAYRLLPWSGSRDAEPRALAWLR